MREKQQQQRVLPEKSRKGGKIRTSAKASIDLEEKTLPMFFPLYWWKQVATIQMRRGRQPQMNCLHKDYFFSILYKILKKKKLNITINVYVWYVCWCEYLCTALSVRVYIFIYSVVMCLVSL